MESTIILKSTNGKKFEFELKGLKDLEKEAKESYNESIELNTAQSKVKSDAKRWQIELQMQRAGKLKHGGIFQVTKKEVCISYKQSLFGGVFKGYSFQMQVLESFQGVPAGTIFKW